jgi:hypothetical protein
MDEIPRSRALEEVTEAAFNGVLLALERRRLALDKFPGPLIVGIIAWPELAGGDFAREMTAQRSPQAE